MTLYLGVDLGTQSVKVVVFDAERGSVIARGASPVEMLPPPHLRADCTDPEKAATRVGVAEQDPADWWRAFEIAMDQALEPLAEARRQIRAIGVSGQQHGMVTLDADLKIIRPAKLWCDTEASAEADELTEKFQRATPAGFTAPKVLWLKRNEPENFKRLRQVLLPHDWLNFLLTGLLSTDHGDASGSGYYLPKERKYDTEGAKYIDPALPAILPNIQEAQSWIGPVREAIAQRFGLNPSVAVAPGSGDNMMSALGAGAVTDGTVVVSLGTSGTLFGHSSKPIIDPTGDIAAFCDATGGWLPLVCTQNCTTVVDDVRKQMEQTHASLTAAAQQVNAGCDGLLYLPYLTGERTPNWPHACGVLHGIRGGHLNPGTLYRAALEGASFALAGGLQALRRHDMAIDQIRLVGGGAGNALWRQILADMFQLPLTTSAEAESAALGGAFQACWIDSGRHPSELYAAIAERADITQTDPNPDHAAVYADAFERYQGVGVALFRN